MTADEHTQTQDPPKVATAVGSKPKSKKKKSLYDQLDLTRYVEYDTVIRHMPFILFIALLMLVYIWNSHYAMRSSKTINANEKKVQQLKWEYLTAKSELEGHSKESEVAHLVETSNLHELKTPPVKIYVNGKERN